MSRSKLALSRRRFLQQAAVGAAVATIVPRNVVGQGQTPPSEEFWGALIGAGGRGGTTFKTMGPGIRLVPQITIVRPPKPEFGYFLDGLPSFPSMSRGV
jgi:hypothetical protein